MIVGSNLTVNDAVARRISKLLAEKNMSQYRLEQESGIQHGSMQCIMNGRNKTVTLSTVIMIAKGFNISLTEFLDDDIFCSDDLEVEQ
ncbi:MAG: helix-turn-helix transcriptional regulator [Ruminococcaceae bacterium]|nr:helix-turn-helix transcriptional regulator [Oscillospiraceae bacterium]